MKQKHFLIPSLLVLFLPFVLVGWTKKPQPSIARNIALLNGQWFDGKDFRPRRVYSINGQFSDKKPARLDSTIDLSGLYIIPPFAEAHNHNIGTGVAERDRKAIQHYLSTGVFYVKIQGNLPLTEATKRQLGLNQPSGLEVSFAQGSLTATGGHPSFLVGEILLRQGYFPGYTKQSLKDYRYFTIDSPVELDQKWPAILQQKPDFIKTFLLFSDEFEKRKNDTTYGLMKGLDPRLLPKIVQKAHADHLRVSAHVSNVADFHQAVVTGVDEITHLPVDTIPIPEEDAKRAAKQGIVVITTCGLAQNPPPRVMPSTRVPKVLAMYTESLKRLQQNGVALAIGSDNPLDSSEQEAFFLRKIGPFDNLTLLKLWVEVTPKTIFPERKIGALREGYEASFVALSGNPLNDFVNVRSIKLRFKQGYLL